MSRYPDLKTEAKFRQELATCWKMIEQLQAELTCLREQEPVAWLSPEGRMFITNTDARFNGTNTDGFTPLYTHPAPLSAVKEET